MAAFADLGVPTKSADATERNDGEHGRTNRWYALDRLDRIDARDETTTTTRPRVLVKVSATDAVVFLKSKRNSAHLAPARDSGGQVWGVYAQVWNFVPDLYRFARDCVLSGRFDVGGGVHVGRAVGERRKV
jgi:hypothetical protein